MNSVSALQTNSEPGVVLRTSTTLNPTVRELCRGGSIVGPPAVTVHHLEAPAGALDWLTCADPLPCYRWSPL
jgi:hypothetical protein